MASSLSADGKWVLGTTDQSTHQVQVLPTGAGEPKVLGNRERLLFQDFNWLPDGKQFIAIGSPPGQAPRAYLYDVATRNARAITPEGVRTVPYTRFVSPDGFEFLAGDAEHGPGIYRVSNGERRPVPGIEPGEVAIGWGKGGSVIHVYRPYEVPARVYELDAKTGARRLWKQLAPVDAAGVTWIRPPRISDDGACYAYNYNRVLSNIYVVSGLK